MSRLVDTVCSFGSVRSCAFALKTHSQTPMLTLCLSQLLNREQKRLNHYAQSHPHMRFGKSNQQPLPCGVAVVLYRHKEHRYQWWRQAAPVILKWWYDQFPRLCQFCVVGCAQHLAGTRETERIAHAGLIRGNPFEYGYLRTWRAWVEREWPCHDSKFKH